MVIITPNNKTIDISASDSSYRYRSIMGDNTITLYFSLFEHREMPVGSYCDFEGERYTLMRPQNVTMQLTAEQTAREQADTAINGEIQGIKNKGTLHDLFLASGATYNQDTKMYQLNGLDLTFNEMLDCYNATKDIYYTENWYSICQLAIFKTNILNVSLAGWRKDITGLYAFANVPNLIKLNLYLKTDNYKLTPTQIRGWFTNDKRLKEIKGIDLLKILNKIEVIEAFTKCIALETIELFNLKVDISFNDSPLLSKESIVHLISNATPSSPITITLHPTAYAMATADPEIQAELEKQPNISLAEGEPTA